MTLASVLLGFGPDGPALRTGQRLPVETMVLGRPVPEVAELLPRLFNLCRVAQGLAARLALGLPATGDLRTEIIRDHVIRLTVILPRAFGLTAPALPADPAELLGRNGLPADGDLCRWDSPLTPLACRITQEFAPGIACTAPLPPPPHPLAEGAYENSAAGRQAGAPALRAVESRYGRGPLWRFVGLLADLEAALADRLPAPVAAEGLACVPAARGAYGLRLNSCEGRVTGIARRTPTDHLLAPGGALLQALGRLPADQRHLAPRIIALHDPCVPVLIEEPQDA